MLISVCLPSCDPHVLALFAMSDSLSLNSSSLPHILEAELAFADRQTLLAARLVLSSMCDLADRLLSGDILDQWSDSADSSASLTATSLP